MCRQRNTLTVGCHLGTAVPSSGPTAQHAAEQSPQAEPDEKDGKATDVPYRTNLWCAMSQVLAPFISMGRTEKWAECTRLLR